MDPDLQIIIHGNLSVFSVGQFGKNLRNTLSQADSHTALLLAGNFFNSLHRQRHRRDIFLLLRRYGQRSTELLIFFPQILTLDLFLTGLFLQVFHVPVQFPYLLLLRLDDLLIFLPCIPEHLIDNENKRQNRYAQSQPRKQGRNTEKLHHRQYGQKYRNDRAGNSIFSSGQKPFLLFPHLPGGNLISEHLSLPFGHRPLQPFFRFPAILFQVRKTAVHPAFLFLPGLPLQLRFLFQFFPLLFQGGKRRLHIQAAVIAPLIICHVVAQFLRQGIPGPRFQLTHRDRIFINILTDAAQQHRKIPVLQRQNLPVCQADQLILPGALRKAPGQPEFLPSAGKFHPPLIPGSIFPGFIAAVHIISRRTTTTALHSKQHTPDKRMHRGLSAFIFSIDHIDSIFQLQHLTAKPSEIVKAQFFQFHRFLRLTRLLSAFENCFLLPNLLLSRIQQRFQSIVQCLLFQLTFRPVKIFGISPDQASGILSF